MVTTLATVEPGLWRWPLRASLPWDRVRAVPYAMLALTVAFACVGIAVSDAAIWAAERIVGDGAADRPGR